MVDIYFEVYGIDNSTNKEILDFLLKRFKIERDKFDISGVYAYTQRLLAYNSNKLRGVYLQKNRQLRYLTMVLCQSRMIIIELKMLRR